MHKHRIAWIVITAIFASCQPAKEIKTTGSIEKLDPELDAVIAVDEKIEVLGEGYTWSEGPVWVKDYNMLLFSDVPQDTVYKWTEAKGVEVYLTPSGYTGTPPANSRERGANGLIINAKGQLVLCQHGDRRVAIMDAPLDKPEPKYITLAGQYNGKRFDSPNDAVFDSKENLYLTDPPYGFKQFEKDPIKETPYQGVYKVFPNGKVIVLLDSLTKPNGIALSPDQKSLFVAVSDPDKAKWYKYELSDSGVVSGKVFFDVTSVAKKENAGVPDGFKINSKGILIGSGPGGLWIINPDGKAIGRIRLPNNTANCALSPDEKTLYITSKNQLLRVKLK